MCAKKEYKKPTATILNADPAHSLEKVFEYDRALRKSKSSIESVKFDNIDEYKQLIVKINEYFIIDPESTIPSYGVNRREYQLIKNIIEFYKTSMIFINLGNPEDMYSYRNTIESVYDTFLRYGDKHYSHWNLNIIWSQHRDVITSIMTTTTYLNNTDISTFNKLTQIGILNICACILKYNSLEWVEDYD